MSFSVVLAGKCGDVVYEFAAVRRLAQERNERADVWLFQHDVLSLTSGEVAALVPLLDSQPYVVAVTRWDYAEPDYPIHEWFREYRHVTNVVKDLLQWLGLDPAQGRGPWLVTSGTMNGLTLITGASSPGVDFRYPPSGD